MNVKENSADYASRSLLPVKLLFHDLCCNGPLWLKFIETPVQEPEVFVISFKRRTNIANIYLRAFPC